MHCPFCNYPDSKVIDSRTADEAIRRRRECLQCGARFTTFERVEAPAVFVVKKDGRREGFSPEKILAGLRKACEKRPLEAGEIMAVAARVQNAVTGMGQNEISSSVIGDLVMRELRELDQIAYVRFASVYRQFTDIDSLRNEIDELQRNGGKAARPREQLPLLSEDTLHELVQVPRVVALPAARERRRAQARRTPASTAASE